MTVSTEVNHNEYTGNGVTTSFPYTFRIFHASDLVVTTSDTNGTLRTLMLNTDYMVTGVGSYSGGAVVLPLPLANAWAISIERSLPVVQETDLRNQGKFFAETHEGAFDYLTMLIQQCFGWVRLALLKPSFIARYYDAKQNRIANLADPSAEQDAVNNRSMRNYVDAAIAGVVGGFGWFIQYGSGAVYRTFQDKMRDVFSVKDFGAKGDYVTDDTAAINAAVAAAGEGGIVYFPRGVYRYVGSLILPPGVKLIGEGSPTMQIAPIESDDKRYMRPGYKHLIPGSSILFSGSATRSKSTARSDRFASFSYALSTSLDYPNQITGLGIIQDMDVYDAAGALTSPSTDNRSNYNCGLLINDATHCSVSDVCVFGYWPVAGTAIVGQASVSNPDYNYFDRFSTTGDIGLAIVGSQNSGTGAEGISGNTFSQCRIHDRTHHDRAGSSVADLGTNAIYVDGVTQVNTNIAGVKFIGCCIRTTVEVPVKLDHCQDVAFIGCTTEMVTNAKYAPAATKHITGTANTGRVVLSGNRMLSSFENIEILAATIKGPLLVDDDSAGVQFFAKDGAGICHGVTDEISGDPFIQFTTDFTNVTRGFNLRYSKATQSLSVNYDNANSLKFNADGTIEAPNGIKQKLSAGGRVSRTISAGAITLPTNSSYISVESEGAAATDDLDTINGGTEGDIIILTSFTSAHDITVKDGTNLRLNGDFVLTTSEDTITLMKSISGIWLEIARSDNSL